MDKKKEIERIIDISEFGKKYIQQFRKEVGEHRSIVKEGVRRIQNEKSRRKAKSRTN